MYTKKNYYLCNVFDSKEYCFIILNFKEMKKLVLSLAVLFSVAMVSCGGKKAEAVDSDSIIAAEEVVAEETVDSNNDTTLTVEAAAVNADSAAAAAATVAQ